MVIGKKLRKLREKRKLTQGDIEKRTGLLRTYISRVESGQTVPRVETLEQFARALQVPMYELFYDGDKPPKFHAITFESTEDDNLFGARGKEAAYWDELRRLLALIGNKDRQLLLKILKEMSAKDG
jgi:transcriptional regulator with XRE-family HTH domain